MISVVIITKNSESSISRCLESVKQLTDDVVVVDSGSTDKTEDLVTSFINTRFIHQTWLGFGPQKAFAAQQAKYDWILSIDSDEWISHELLESIKLIDFNKINKTDVFILKRQNKFMGKMLNHGAGYPDKVIRIFNRLESNWNNNLVHEKINFSGKSILIDGRLFHDPCESLSIFISKQNRYTDTQSLTNVSSYKVILSPLARFLKEYFIKLGFLDGIPGLIYACTNAYFAMLKQAKRIENKQKKDY